METNVFKKMAFAAADTAAPTAVSVGSNIDWTLEGDWTTCGSIDQFSDDCDFDADTVGFSPLREVTGHKPPLSMANHIHSILGDSWEDVTAQIYGAHEVIYDKISSRHAVAANVSQPTSVTTNRACIIEVNEFGEFYIPSALVLVDVVGGGVSEVFKATLTIKPEQDGTYKAGYMWRERV